MNRPVLQIFFNVSKSFFSFFDRDGIFLKANAKIEVWEEYACLSVPIMR
jgi:hypothetical protein